MVVVVGLGDFCFYWMEIKKGNKNINFLGTKIYIYIIYIYIFIKDILKHL